jgi:dolichyl-phosphate beta-glucosyltransferase
VRDARQNPYLSIVIPAYNEERRLPPTLARIAAFLREQAYRSEVLIVENGSTDGTSAAVETFCATELRPGDPFDLVLLHSEKGKGNAVRHGMLNGRGEFLLISDTDLAVPIEEVTRFLPPALPKHGYGVAIASREAPGAVRLGEPFYRHLMGRIFNQIVRWMAIPGISDTQCGFKCFSREAAQLVIPRQRISGYGFDVEMLFIAQRLGIELVEVPVTWYYGDDSRIRPIHDTLAMVRELMQIRRNGRAGLYDAPAAATTDGLRAV